MRNNDNKSAHTRFEKSVIQLPVHASNTGKELKELSNAVAKRLDDFKR
jgi:hypothetical protein